MFCVAKYSSFLFYMLLHLTEDVTAVLSRQKKTCLMLRAKMIWSSMITRTGERFTANYLVMTRQERRENQWGYQHDRNW